MADRTLARSEHLSKRQEYELVRSSLWAERSTFDAHWRDLGDYVLPRRPRWFTTDRNKGDRRNQKIIDETGTFAARTLQSGMHAGITSPARPWMKLTTPDPGLAQFGPVKEWLHEVTQRMLTVFLRSNLYNVLPTQYGDMGVFATAAMSVLEDDKDVIRCYSYPVGSYALGANDRGVCDVFVREWQMTVRQIVSQFGLVPVARGSLSREIDWTNISKTVRSLWERASYEQTVDVNWVVAPNTYADSSRLGGKFLPYSSCHFEKGQERDDVFLRESGFNEFPVMGSRWDITGEDVYGTMSPGMLALGSIKQLQTMQKRKAQAIEKMINPPLQAPTHVRNQKASLLPADITYVDVREGQKGIAPIHEVRIDISHLTADITETRNMIRRSFYEDLFLMLAQSDRREITAREIEERHEEKLLALGPVLERTNDELLDPVVDRVFNIMARRGLIPPAPQELRDVDLKVEYISLMAQAQKLVGVAGHERFLSTAAQLAPIFPDVVFKIDVFQAIDDHSDMLGVNPKLVVPNDQARAAADAAHKAAAKAQAAAVAKDATGAVSNLAATPMGQDSALDRLMANAGST
jgi:hypothetical protein